MLTTLIEIKRMANSEKISFNHPQWAESNNKILVTHYHNRSKVSEITPVLNPIMMWVFEGRR